MTTASSNYLELFLEESLEQVDQLNLALLELEKDFSQQEIINEIFRVIHSLKSAAAFVGQDSLSSLCHKMESLLQEVRDGERAMDKTFVNLLFKGFDIINDNIKQLESTGNVTGLDDQYAEITRELEKLAGGGAAPSKKEARKKGGQVRLSAEQKKQVKEFLSQGEIVWQIRVLLEPNTPMKSLRVDLAVQGLLRLDGELLFTIPDNRSEEGDQGLPDEFLIFFASRTEPRVLHDAVNVDMVRQIRLKKINPDRLTGGASRSEKKQKEAKTVRPKKPESADQKNAKPKTETAAQNGNGNGPAEAKNGKNGKSPRPAEHRPVTQKSVRVSTDKLDTLINEVGELVIANSGFQKIQEDLSGILGQHPLVSDFSGRIDRMARIARQLQDVIINTRMFPIGPVFHRFHRLVRDLSEDKGKQVRLEILGEDTELDKEVVDLIGEPLMHLIRNSVDHGLESEADRLAAGKDPAGTVQLNAYQSGNQINIEITDDGRGLNAGVIKNKIAEKGLATMATLEELSDQEIFEYIFHPGFSTAKEVTDISGRGVGMNVVKKMVDDHKGEIQIETYPGEGTMFTLVFPLTMAIISAIMVKMKHEVYAIPLSDVIETIRVPRGEITTLENQEIINLRGEILPLIHLNQLMNIEGDLLVDEEDQVSVVVVHFNKKKAGFIVEGFIGKQEIVIKNIERNYQHVPGVAGAAILGDGQIVLILDVKEFLNLAGMGRSGNVEERGSGSWSLRSGNQSQSDEEIESLNKEIRILIEENALQKTSFELSGTNQALNPEADWQHLVEQALSQAPAESPPAGTTPPIPSPSQGSVEPVTPEPQATGTTTWETSGPGSQAETVDEAGTGPDDGDPHSLLSPFLEDVDEKEKESIMSEWQNKPDEPEDKAPSRQFAADVSSPEEKAPATSGELLPGFADAEMRQLEKMTHTGLANAGLVLSQLLGMEVSISAPTIRQYQVEELIEEFEANKQTVEIQVGFLGEIQGFLVVFFDLESAQRVGEILLGTKEELHQELASEDLQSAMMEITNIVGASVLNSIADQTEVDLTPDVPHYFQRDVRQFIQGLGLKNKTVLYLNTDFVTPQRQVTARMLIFLDFLEVRSLLKIWDEHQTE